MRMVVRSVRGDSVLSGPLDTEWAAIQVVDDYVVGVRRCNVTLARCQGGQSFDDIGQKVVDGDGDGGTISDVGRGGWNGGRGVLLGTLGPDTPAEAGVGTCRCKRGVDGHGVGGVELGVLVTGVDDARGLRQRARAGSRGVLGPAKAGEVGGSGGWWG